ncbi:MAG: T9SS type A sorting domain-containing protein [Bacteroidetes bacterium]|nr:T9SS type A sorting domain-containing protein [Bacteroidota bacterium]
MPGGLPDWSTQQNPIVQYNTAGNYPVSLTISNLSGTNTYFLPGNINVKNCITGEDETSAPASIRIYPNPFTNNFSIENNSPNVVNAIIRTLQGVVVQTVEISGNEKRIISSGNLAKGLYLVELISESSRQTIKLIRQ